MAKVYTRRHAYVRRVKLSV